MTPPGLFVDYEGEGGSTMTRNPSIHRSPFSNSVELMLLLTFIGLLAGCSTASTGGSLPPSVSAIKGTVSIFTLPTAASDPAAITAGPDGNVWFTQVSGTSSGPSSKIGRITSTGTMSEFPPSALTGNLGSITLGPDGNLWFTDGSPRQIAKIEQITPQGARREFLLPSSDSPGRITSGPDGKLWFTEPGVNGQTGKIGSFTIT
jgi:streptogramin lyase